MNTDTRHATPSTLHLPPSTLLRLHATISGVVQGVCFRMDAREEARRLGLTGWVRNLPNGDVETVAEGDETAVNRYLAWCHRGPPAAEVSGVDSEFAPATGEFQGFGVRY
jgi:acylphosphatase